MDNDTLVDLLGKHKFYQTIDLGDGISTPGLPREPKQKEVLRLIGTLDLRGKRVVELGCANGLFALAAERQGADEVLAVDNTRKNIESLESIIIPRLASRIRPVLLNALDFNEASYGKFDLVIFAGLLYHLKYPFSALRTIRDLLSDDGVLILETGIIEDFNTNALLFCPSPKDSPQKSRGGNACAYFNEKALIETLAYFGIRTQYSTVTVNPFKRLLKKICRRSLTSYRISNMVVLGKRDPSIENSRLIEFYESTTP